jgi:hypothetical protein
VSKIDAQGPVLAVVLGCAKSSVINYTPLPVWECSVLIFMWSLRPHATCSYPIVSSYSLLCRVPAYPAVVFIVVAVLSRDMSGPLAMYCDSLVFNMYAVSALVSRTKLHTPGLVWIIYRRYEYYQAFRNALQQRTEFVT